jgi:hypothetical protein
LDSRHYYLASFSQNAEEYTLAGWPSNRTIPVGLLVYQQQLNHHYYTAGYAQNGEEAPTLAGLSAFQCPVRFGIS